MASRLDGVDTSSPRGNRPHEDAPVVWPDPSPLTPWWTDVMQPRDAAARHTVETESD